MAAGHEDERPLAVVQAADGAHPHAMVFTGSARRRPAARLKRDRYVLNLQRQYAGLKESLAAAERFFATCETSAERVAAIRKAHEAALEELSDRFQAKINEYDRRIERGS